MSGAAALTAIRARAFGIALAAACGATCGGAPDTSGDGAAAAPPAPAQRLGVEVLATWPHDPEAYTQGLVWDGGALLESLGGYGASALRRVDLRTGRVERQVDLPDDLFGEGLARVGDRLVQLTWREGRALLYGAADFAPRGEWRYEGEGWGLAYDSARLVMSDGSDRLQLRDPRTFALLGSVAVTHDGRPVTYLNELEFAEGALYANVWLSDTVVRIDPANGRVTATIDASGLLSEAERAGAEVLNGIAYDPEHKVFYLTGKRWPKLFEVRFVER
jgi:glutamine cyclotransferase